MGTLMCVCGRGDSNGNLVVKGNSDVKRDPDGRGDYDVEPDVKEALI